MPGGRRRDSWPSALECWAPVLLLRWESGVRCLRAAMGRLVERRAQIRERLGSHLLTKRRQRSMGRVSKFDPTLDGLMLAIEVYR